MVLKVNGEERTINQYSLTVAELLTICNVESPELVSVQLNRTFLDRDGFATAQVHDNDEVDFLYFLGGGR